MHNFSLKEIIHCDIVSSSEKGYAERGEQKIYQRLKAVDLFVLFFIVLINDITLRREVTGYGYEFLRCGRRQPSHCSN